MSTSSGHYYVRKYCDYHQNIDHSMISNNYFEEYIARRHHATPTHDSGANFEGNYATKNRIYNLPLHIKGNNWHIERSILISRNILILWNLIL